MARSNHGDQGRLRSNSTPAPNDPDQPVVRPESLKPKANAPPSSGRSSRPRNNNGQFISEAQLAKAREDSNKRSEELQNMTMEEIVAICEDLRSQNGQLQAVQAAMAAKSSTATVLPSIEKPASVVKVGPSKKKASKSKKSKTNDNPDDGEPSDDDPDHRSRRSSRRHSKKSRRHRSPSTSPSESSSSSSSSPDNSDSEAEYVHGKSKFISSIEKLDDGKSPEWEQWLISIKGRLKHNRDHYPTASARKHLIYGHTTGVAERILRHKFNKKSKHGFKDYQDMINHLRPGFEDVMQKERARVDYQALQQGDYEPFNDFHFKFLEIAAMAGISRKNWLGDLKTKVNDSLGRMTIGAAMTSRIFEEYVGHLQYADSDRMMRAERKKTLNLQATKRAAKVIAHGGGSMGGEITKKTIVPTVVENHTKTYLPERLKSQTPAPTKSYGTPAPDRDLSNVTCYECGEKGHLSKNCTKPKVAIRHVDAEGNESEIASTEELSDDQGKRQCLRKVSFLGRERIDLGDLDLTKLMGGQSITMESSIEINGLAVCLQTLIDDGAISFLVFNSRIANDVAEYLQRPIRKLPQSYKVTGFDAVVRTVVTQYLKAHFAVEGRKFYNTPFVIADIGHHDLIMGKLFLERMGVLVSPQEHRILWPDRLPPTTSVMHQRLMYPDQIVRQQINRRFQEESERRDAQIGNINTSAKYICPQKRTNNRPFSQIRPGQNRPQLRPSTEVENAPEVDPSLWPPSTCIERQFGPPGPEIDSEKLAWRAELAEITRKRGILNITKAQRESAKPHPPPTVKKEVEKPQLRIGENSYRFDQARAYRAMEEELSGELRQEETPELLRPEGVSTPSSVKPLESPSIALISGQAMVCNLKRASNEAFVTSICEIDAIIREKYEATLATEDDETQSLLKERLPEQYWEYADVFSKRESNELPPYREGVDHKIDLTEPLPTHWSPLYKQSLEELQATKKWITENMDKGFIDHSNATFASPILFVKKKDGSLRLCVDYRKLNLITKKDPYPIPLIEELISRVSKAKIFTKLDIRAAFNRIRMDPASEDATSFRCPIGVYKSRVLPFGLTNGPATFQRWINKILFDFLDDFCAAYMDDILIYSEDPLEHEIHVKRVLDRLRANGLQADIKKSEFAVTSTKFLGYILTTDGIEVDPDKTEALRTWRYPNTVTETRGFLGFTGFYRQFVKDFQRIAKPLNNLTKEGVPFHFDDDCKRAFEELRNALLSPAVLKHFQFGLPTMVETDSSDGTIGGIISQQHVDGSWHPTAFYSKTMLPAECNYEIHDKELLAIVRIFEKYRAELQSTPNIQVFSDHRALEYFMTTKSLTSRQVGWAETLANYDFRIEYRSGKLNKADILTRRLQDKEIQSAVMRDNRYRTLLTPERLSDEVRIDMGLLEVETPASLAPIALAPLEILSEPLPLLDKLFEENRQSHLELRKELPTGYSLEKDVLYKDGRLVLLKDSVLTTRLIEEAHCQLSSAHPGAHKTYVLLKSRYYWLGMEADIERYIDNCIPCKKSKTSRTKQPGFLHPLPVPDRPWEHLTMDLMDAPKTRLGNDCVWVCMDRFTKNSIEVACTRDINAKDIARLFFQHVWAEGHTPVSIVSDRGPQFISSMWDHFCTIIGTKVVLSTAFHKETDGQTEIMNQYLAQRLRPYVNYYQDDWDELLPGMRRAQRTLPHSSLGDLSPYEVTTGWEPRTSFDWTTPKAKKPSEKLGRRDAVAYAKRLEEVHQFAKEKLQHTQDLKAEAVNKHRRPIDWTTKDKVYLSTKNLRTGRPMRKLENKWEGPFPILAQKGNSYKLKLPPAWKIHPTFAPELLRKYPDNPLPGQNTESNSEDYYEEVVDDKEYEVTEILASRIYSRKLQYRAKWKGFTDDVKWYDYECFENAPFKLRDFHQRYPQAKGPPKELKRWIKEAENDTAEASRGANLD